MAQELAGFRVLVVEDEYFLAVELEDELEMAGAVVIGPIGDLEGALQQVRGDGFDLAVLDLNLGGNRAYPVADALAERGVPFVFASAYTSAEIPLRHEHVRLVEKPYSPSSLIKGLIELTTNASRPASLQAGAFREPTK